MDIKEAILTRRSIRNYEDKEVSDELIRELLKGAMASPSANNKQPWEFLVLRDREKMDNIININPEATPLKTADVAIVVCGNLDVYKGYKKNINFWIQDCAAATQNILLMAHGKGLGAVWIGIYPATPRTEDVSLILNLPENIIPLSIISIGYPLNKVEPSNRYKENKIHYDIW